MLKYSINLIFLHAFPPASPQLIKQPSSPLIRCVNELGWKQNDSLGFGALRGATGPDSCRAGAGWVSPSAVLQQKRAFRGEQQPACLVHRLLVNPGVLRVHRVVTVFR